MNHRRNNHQFAKTKSMVLVRFMEGIFFETFQLRQQQQFQLSGALELKRKWESFPCKDKDQWKKSASHGYVMFEM